LKDPTFVCTSYKKNRFYLITRREPPLEDENDQKLHEERDINNEKIIFNTK
jgi:peptidylprolyl isomerase domain and WD repeat-containing protein 1